MYTYYAHSVRTCYCRCSCARKPIVRRRPRVHETNAASSQQLRSLRSADKSFAQPKFAVVKKDGDETNVIEHAKLHDDLDDPCVGTAIIGCSYAGTSLVAKKKNFVCASRSYGCEQVDSHGGILFFGERSLMSVNRSFCRKNIVLRNIGINVETLRNVFPFETVAHVPSTHSPTNSVVKHHTQLDDKYVCGTNVGHRETITSVIFMSAWQSTCLNY